MQIDGWVAIGKFGLVLGSFREERFECESAARQILRLIGGPPFLAGFEVRPAALTIADPPKTEPGAE
jgi:hypothetical protein